jgi:integrase
MRVALTDRFCAAAKALGAPQADFFDETTTGLSLRVSADGRKSWCLLYTSPKTGKRARMTLAGYPATSLAAARAMVLEAKGKLDQGTDPKEAEAAEEASAITVGGLAELYFQKPHKRTGRPRKTVNEIKRRFARNILPVIGDVKITELQRRDVMRVVSPIMRREAPTEASRTFEDVRGLLRWALGQGYIDRNPAEAMEPPVAKSPPRERVLDHAEIRTLWNGLPKALARSVQCQRILKLCLVTAQRVGEVAGMRPGEINFRATTWTIPASRSKNGFAHEVPLSALAVKLIREALADAGKDAAFVFPAGNGSLPAAAVARTVSRTFEDDKAKGSRFGIAHFTSHDLRRTAATELGEMKVLPIVIAHVIGHRSVTRAGVTLAAYVQYGYDAEKKLALDLWADRLAAIVAGKPIPKQTFLEALQKATHA